MHSESIGLALGKRWLGIFLPNHQLQWMVDGELWKTWFFSLTSTIFNFSLQGTFQLLEGRDIVRQCSRELRAYRAAKPGFWSWFGMETNWSWFPFPWPQDMWSLGWKRVDMFVPVSQFIKIQKEGNESVSPICEPGWISIWAGILRIQGTGAGCQQASS